MNWASEKGLSGADTARHYRGMDLRLQRLGQQALMNVEGTRDDNRDGETSNAIQLRAELCF